MGSPATARPLQGRLHTTPAEVSTCGLQKWMRTESACKSEAEYVTQNTPSFCAPWGPADLRKATQRTQRTCSTHNFEGLVISENHCVPLCLSDFTFLRSFHLFSIVNKALFGLLLVVLLACTVFIFQKTGKSCFLTLKPVLSDRPPRSHSTSSSRRGEGVCLCTTH